MVPEHYLYKLTVEGYPPDWKLLLMPPVSETLAKAVLRKCQAQTAAGNVSGLDQESTGQLVAFSFHVCDSLSYQKTGNWSMVAQRYGRRSGLF